MIIAIFPVKSCVPLLVTAKLLQAQNVRGAFNPCHEVASDNGYLALARCYATLSLLYESSVLLQSLPEKWKVIDIDMLGTNALLVSRLG